MRQQVPHKPEASLCLLGGFALSYGPDRLTLCASAERLLAFLAVYGRARPIRRSILAESLWCDADPARAAASLRSALWRLPRPDGRQLVWTSANDLQLCAEVRVDLWHAEDAADVLISGDGGEEAVRPQAIEQLSGDLLPGWSEDWLLIEQETFRQTRLHALERSCALLRSRGRFSAALKAGLAAVKCEPLRESAHREVIEVHLAEDNHAEAIRQYQSFRRLLAHELGLPPSPAIRRLVAPLLGRPVDVP